MIASVIIRLKHKVGAEKDRLEALLALLGSEPRLEVGEIVDQRCLPATLDCVDENDVHDLTRWLQSLSDVEFVDVVFVCLEQEHTAESLKSSRSNPP